MSLQSRVHLSFEVRFSHSFSVAKLVLATLFLTLSASSITYSLFYSYQHDDRSIDQSIFAALSLASIASGAIIRRYDLAFQSIPATAKPDNMFNCGTFLLASMIDVIAEIPSAVYGARSIDLPFGRLYHGNMKFFGKGRLNTPDGIQDVYKPGVNDFAYQSACGIPDNAFFMSKVAIHPYFLKYADLSRKLFPAREE